LFFKAFSNISPGKKWTAYHQICYLERNEISSMNVSVASKHSPIVNINYSDIYDSEFYVHSSRENLHRSQINLAEELRSLPNEIENLDSSHYNAEDLNKSLNKILYWWSPLKFFWDKIFWLIGLDSLIIPIYIKMFFDLIKFVMFARNIDYDNSRHFVHEIFLFISKLLIYKLYFIFYFFVLIIFGDFFCILSILFS